MANEVSVDVNELQPLAQLVIRGDFRQVRRLATKELVKATDGARRTVLMLVADAPETPVQSEKCILYLFHLGADPIASDEAGDTAAHLAARRGHVRLLGLLPFDGKWLQNKRGLTPLMEAAWNGNMSCTKHLLHLLRQKRFNDCRKFGNSERERLLELTDLKGRTALDFASLSLSVLTGENSQTLVDVVEREMRLVVDEVGRISGLTAKEAAKGPHENCHCELPRWDGKTLLMNHGYSMDCSCRSNPIKDVNCADAVSLSLLHHAALNMPARNVFFLQAGAVVNARDWFERTPLMLAAGPCVDYYGYREKQLEKVRVLLYVGADWTLKDELGRTALDMAVEAGNTEIADHLRGYEGRGYFDEQQPNQ